MRKLMMITTLATMAGTSVVAKPALRDVQVIDDGLFTVGLAHEIRKNCPHISGRIFKAMGVLRDLADEARALGYSDHEIRAHVESDVEKDRMRARAADYMKDRGFKQNKKGYCALGKAEMTQKSEIGALLRSSN